MSWTNLFKDLGFGFQIGGEIASAFQNVNRAKVSEVQSNAQKMANEAQATVADNNAQYADWQAKDALYRGATEVGRIRLRTAGLKGAQRARMGASGVTMDSDSPNRLLTDTDILGQMDVDTAASNADREAWALRSQAQDSRNRAEILRRATVPVPDSPSNALIGSLLSGGGKLAESWYKWSR